MGLGPLFDAGRNVLATFNLHAVDATYGSRAVWLTIMVVAVSTAYHLYERGRGNAAGVFELPVFGAVGWLWAYGRGHILDGIVALCQLHDWRTFTIKWLGEKRFIMTTDPRNIEHILKTAFSKYNKGTRFHATLTDLLGNGIFVSDGERWTTHRKMASHMFTANNFRGVIMSAFIKHGRELQAILDRAAGALPGPAGAEAARAPQPQPDSSGPAAIAIPASAATGAAAASSVPSAPVDMFRLLNCFTLDSIGDIAFGSSIGSLHQPDTPFARAFDDAQATLDQRFFTPYWQLWRRLGFMPAEKRLDQSIATMNAFCRDLINARRAEGAATEGGLEARGDVLSRFMCLTDETTGKPLYAAPTPENDSALRDVILNFMIAGRDTTAQAVSWTLYELCQHPEVEARVVEEVRALETLLASGGGSDLHGSDGATSSASASFTQPQPSGAASADGGTSSPDSFAPSYDDILAHLRYTKATVQEALRLHPSVPKDAKEAMEDDVWPDGTRVPKGCYAAYLPHAMGRCDKLWPDPLRFDPGRFIGPEARKNLSPFKYAVFNAGPRTCLGQAMALVEASFLLALLYRRYTFSLAPPQSQQGSGSGSASAATSATPASREDLAAAVRYQDSLTLPVQGGLWMTVRRRA